MDDALLAAIRAAPDDDSPRLVLADALMEQGDPRGELIAVQCELAAGGLTRERAIALRKRESRILSSQGAGWARIPLPRSPVTGEFRRGFIESVVIGAEWLLTHFVELMTKAPLLREVHLTTIPEVQVIEQIIDLPGIEAIGVLLPLGGNPVARLSSQKRLGKLTGLALRRVAPGALGELSRARYGDRIERLRLHGELSPSVWTDEARARLPDDNTAVRPRVLAFGGERRVDDIATELDVRLRAGVGRALFARVEELEIETWSRALAPGRPTLAFEGTGVLPRLKKLAARTELGRDFEALAACKELTRLEELHLTPVEQHDFAGGWRRIGALFAEVSLPHLRVLSLRDGLVNAAATRELLALPLVRDLEVLDVRGAPDSIEMASIAREWDGLLLA